MVTSEAIAAEWIAARQQAQAWDDDKEYGPSTSDVLALRSNVYLQQLVDYQHVTALRLSSIEQHVQRIGRIQRRANRLLERVAITLHEISKAAPDDDPEPPDPSLDLDGQQPGRARAEGEAL